VICDLNLHDCAVNCFEFSSAFELAATKDSVVDAFVTWFDVLFDDMPKKFSLSTSPSAKATHWKQTWFYIESQRELHVGDVISGRIEFRQHPDDEFGLVVALEFKINDEQSRALEYDFC